MKVICIQNNPSYHANKGIPDPVIGEFYTVIKVLGKGVHIFNFKIYRLEVDYYMLKEFGIDCIYPSTFFSNADEIELSELTVEELLQEDEVFV